MLTEKAKELIEQIIFELARQHEAKELTKRQYIEALTRVADLEDVLDSK
jgi:hypothetical protein